MNNPRHAGTILFFGPDGSGKSTLARNLAEDLRGRGLRVKISWMRGTHTFASLVASLFSKFKVFQGSENPYYNISIPPSMKFFWQILEFFSAIPLILSRYIFPEFLGFWVVGERGVLDLMVWTALVTKDESYLDRILSRFLVSLAIRSYAKVYVTAELTTLLKRRSDVSADMLMAQLKLYERLSIAVGAYTLDTSGKSTRDSLETLKLLLES